MQPNNDSIYSQVRTVINDNDPAIIQYLMPALKLLRYQFSENGDRLVSMDELTLILDTMDYLVKATTNAKMDKRIINEASLVVSYMICDIQERIPKIEEAHHRFLSLLISLLNCQKGDNTVSFTIMVYLQRMSSEILRIPRPLLAELCRICSTILAQPEQSRNSLCTIALSMVCELIQLSENMDWFVNNGLIFQLSVLLNRECTVVMCRLFFIILNQLAINESYHAELLRSIGVTLVINCIRTFVNSSIHKEKGFHIAELCFLYLIRLFINEPKTVIQHNLQNVTDLIHFLLEALYSPLYVQYTIDHPALTETTIPLFIHNEEMMLCDYVMTLFALLCYNSESPEIIHAASIAEVCSRINDITTVNIVLFLHQFLYYSTLVSIIAEQEHFQNILDNLQRFPSESLLTVFARVLHSQVENKTTEEIYNYLFSLSTYGIASLLISILLTDSNYTNEQIDTPVSVDSIIPSDSIRNVVSDGGKDETISETREVVSHIRLIALDLLSLFFTNGFSIILDDSFLILRLFTFIRMYLQSENEMNQQIIHQSCKLLISISLHSQNFSLLENESSFISQLCDLIILAQSSLTNINNLFCPLYQYAKYGGMQKLVSDERFVKLLSTTKRLIGDSSTFIQSVTSFEAQDDFHVMPILAMTFGIVKIFKILSGRLKEESSPQYPVMGEIFLFLSTSISTIVCDDIIICCTELCTDFWHCGSSNIQERLRSYIAESFNNVLKKGVVGEECSGRISSLLELMK